MKRGDIWWATLPPPAGRRPVVLLSRNDAYAVRELVTVAPVTTRIRRIPVEIPLGIEEGLPKPCVANLDIVTTIPMRVLASRIGALSAVKLDALDDALCFALGVER